MIESRTQSEGSVVVVYVVLVVVVAVAGVISLGHDRGHDLLRLYRFYALAPG